MSDVQHVINRRINLLAEAVTREVDVIAAFYSPAGGQRAMTEQHTSDEAWALWSKHRFSDIGKHIVSQMQPADIAELDRWLAQETARRTPSKAVV